jgi:hypothetical protein
MSLFKKAFKLESDKVIKDIFVFEYPIDLLILLISEMQFIFLLVLLY